MEKIIYQVDRETLEEVISSVVQDLIDRSTTEKASMNVDDMAEYLGISKEKSRRLCRNNPDIAVKTGKTWLISKKNLDEAIQCQRIRLGKN